MIGHAFGPFEFRTPQYRRFIPATTFTCVCCGCLYLHCQGLKSFLSEFRLPVSLPPDHLIFAQESLFVLTHPKWLFARLPHLKWIRLGSVRSSILRFKMHYSGLRAFKSPFICNGLWIATTLLIMQPYFCCMSPALVLLKNKGSASIWKTCKLQKIHLSWPILRVNRIGKIKKNGFVIFFRWNLTGSPAVPLPRFPDPPVKE